MSDIRSGPINSKRLSLRHTDILKVLYRFAIKFTIKRSLNILVSHRKRVATLYLVKSEELENK